MPRIERNFEQTLKNLKRDVVELKRTSQASLVGYVDKETGKIKDTLEDLNVDVRSPAAPVEVVTDFFVYESYNAKRREGYITIASAPVTKATDGSDIQVAKYEMWLRSANYEPGSEPPFELQSSSISPSLRSLPVEQYQPYEVAIRALTLTGRPGAFSEVKTVTVTDDDAPPPMPSSLVLGQRTGVIVMQWDGLSFGGTMMPLDFHKTEIGIRSGSETEYTLIGEWFEEAGYRYYGNAPFDTAVYVSHRSVDYAGNTSEWTQPSMIVVEKVVNDETLREHLTQIENEIDLVSQDLAESRTQLQDNLDQLQVDLTAAENSLDNLETVELPALNQRIDDAQADTSALGTQLSDRLTLAEADITEAENNLTNLNDVVIPGVNSRLDQAESDIVTSGNELNTRLDQAFVEIGENETATAEVVEAVTTAQETADEARRRADNAASILTNVAKNPKFLNGEEDWLFRGANSVYPDMGWVIGANMNDQDNVLFSQSAEAWNVTARVPDILFDNGATSAVSAGQIWRATWGVYFLYAMQAVNPRASIHLQAHGITGEVLAEDFLDLPVGAHSYDLEVEIPDYAYYISAGVKVTSDTPAPNQDTFTFVIISELKVANVTELSEAMALAEKAEADALAAQQAAGEAMDNAQDALVAAGTKTTSYRATTSPVGVGSVDGDTWRQIDSNGNVIGVWLWDGDSWNKSLVTSEAIDNLDVGKLTAGSAAITEAVIEKLWADVIRARKITADQVIVGQGSNLVHWPAGDELNAMPNIQYYGGPHTAQTPGWQRDGGVTGGDHIFILREDISVDVDTNVVSIGAGPRTGVLGEHGFSVEPGEKYLFSAYLRLGGSYTSGSPLARFGIYFYGADGSYIQGVLGTQTAITWEWQKVSTNATVPDGAAKAVIYLRQNRPGGLRMDLPAFYKMTDGSLIVNGSITGDHVNANSVAAAVGQFIDLDVSQLTASSATISTAVVNKLWSEVITARKITSEMVQIGGMDNLFSDPRMQDSDGWSGSGTHYTTTGRYGGGSIVVNSGTTQRGIYYALTDSDKHVDLQPGHSYYVSMQVRTASAAPAGSLSLYMRFYNESGSSYIWGDVSNFRNESATTANTWVEIGGKITVPESGYHYLTIGGYVQSAYEGTVRFSNPSVTQMSTGKLIVNGSVDADAINTNSVSAEIAKVMKLDVAQLVASSASISQAVIDKLWVDVIRAYKISADQVLIGAGLNILPNAGFTNEGWPGFGRNTSNGPDGQPSIWIGGRETINSPSFPVEGGKPYKFRHSFMQSQKSSYYIQIITDTGSLYLVNNKQNTGTNIWYGDSTILDPTGPTFRHGVEFTMPAGATSAKLRFYGNHTNGPVTTGYQWFTNLGLYLMTDSSLVVDGTISARHINASESLSAKVGQFLTVTADMLAANAVVAGKIKAGAIDSMIITGAVVRTSTSSTRMEMNTTGLHAWKSGNKTFTLSASTGEISAVGSIQTGLDTTYRAKLSNRDGIAALDIYGSGGDSAPHLALIYQDSTSVLRNYTNVSSYNAELAMTNTWAHLSHSSNGQVYLGGSYSQLTHDPTGSRIFLGSTVEVKLGGTSTRLHMSSSSVSFGKALDGSLTFTSSSTRLTDSNMGTLIEDGTLSGSKTMYMPLISNVTTTGSANVNCNNGWTREVSSASRYKLAVRTMDESLDDKILSIEAKTWIDKSNSEIASAFMAPAKDGEDRPEPPAGLLDRQPGVIAEEVLDAGLEEFVIFNSEGEVQSVMYDRLGVALIPVVKRQRDKIADQGSKIADLEDRLARLESVMLG